MLSISVAKLLEYYDDPDTEEMREFILKFDRFFDCLNSRHLKAGVEKRKRDLNPYFSPRDERLEVCS